VKREIDNHRLAVNNNQALAQQRNQVIKSIAAVGGGVHVAI
jgi:hypothetical protein